MEAGREPPRRPEAKRTVAIPSTLFLEEREPLKTWKVGFLARVLSIFRIAEVSIFIDRGAKRNAFYIADVLRYAETPQYLRKELMPLKRSLKYVGVIPPLQAPHHPQIVGGFSCEFREGIVVDRRGDEVLVYVGLPELVRCKGGEVGIGSRVTVRLLGGHSGVIIPRGSVPYYWGYDVHIVNGLKGVLRRWAGCVKIGTSRFGEDLRELVSPMAKEIQKRGGMLVVFGSRDRGLLEICRDEGLDATVFDFFVNFIPEQGTLTVRTEEAIIAVLSILNILTQ